MVTVLSQSSFSLNIHQFSEAAWEQHKNLFCFLSVATVFRNPYLGHLAARGTEEAGAWPRPSPDLGGQPGEAGAGGGQRHGDWTRPGQYDMVDVTEITLYVTVCLWSWSDMRLWALRLEKVFACCLVKSSTLSGVSCDTGTENVWPGLSSSTWTSLTVIIYRMKWTWSSFLLLLVWKKRRKQL